MHLGRECAAAAAAAAAAVEAASPWNPVARAQARGCVAWCGGAGRASSDPQWRRPARRGPGRGRLAAGEGVVWCDGVGWGSCWSGWNGAMPRCCSLRNRVPYSGLKEAGGAHLPSPPLAAPCSSAAGRRQETADRAPRAASALLISAFSMPTVAYLVRPSSFVLQRIGLPTVKILVVILTTIPWLIFITTMSSRPLDDTVVTHVISMGN